MKNDEYTRGWITENAIDIVGQYSPGDLTIRGLHYQLVGRGMINSTQHYKRVVAAMGVARREGLIDYATFSDHDREMTLNTSWTYVTLEDSLEDAKSEIEAWMTAYSLNRWSNQDVYPEVWIEKRALIGTFKSVCARHRVALAACKGYPSLTFLNESAGRFLHALDEGKRPVILYFGDYDPSGEDIPRKIQESLAVDFGVEIDLKRIALMEGQVVKWQLPPAPVKLTDSRTASWDGLGQVELDAVSPERIHEMLDTAISSQFSEEVGQELRDREREERKEYQEALKLHVNSLADED